MKKQTKNQVNFLPEDYQQRRSQQRTNIVCMILFVLVSGGVGVSVWQTQNHRRVVDAEYAAVGRELQKMQETLKQVEVLEQRKKQMESKAAICAQLVEPVPRSLLLAMITNYLPDGVSLVKYDLKSTPVVDKTTAAADKANKKALLKKNAKKDEAPAEAPCPKIKTIIKVTGLAQNDLQVADFITNMNRSNLLGQVNLGVSKEIKVDESILRQFELDIVLPAEARASAQDVQLAREWYAKRQMANQPATQKAPGLLKTIAGKVLDKQ